ncbi:MAG TPA: hypothetical protein VEA69_23815 [Tepidisphaeraceae bacterium]|nr:hypothetical protein [Tepidisphaeraceae bacterium]
MRFIPLLIALVSVPAFAALPPQRPADLKKTATHVVTGTVAAVYTTEAALDRPGMVNKLFAVEFAVTAVEKGEGLAEGKVVFAKCWKPAKRPTGFAGPQGQNALPAVGETGRLYLKLQADGTYAVLTPNGWEIAR